MSPELYRGLAVGVILGYVTYHLFKRISRPVISGNNHKFVMILRTDIEKRKGAEYCSQVVLECYKQATRMTPEYVKKWEKNSQPKITLKLDENSNENILKLKQKAESLGIVSVIIKDVIMKKETFTVLGIGPAPEDLVDRVSGHLKLF